VGVGVGVGVGVRVRVGVGWGLGWVRNHQARPRRGAGAAQRAARQPNTPRHTPAPSPAPASSGRAPGADDNASGVAALLQAARVSAGLVFNRTLRFLVTTGEEQGYLGSTAYARALADSEADVVAVLNLDML
jgi:hypothetical protein